MTRPELRDLLRSALLGILPVALATVAVALLAASKLQLSGFYVVKGLTVFSTGAVLVLLGLPGHHPFRSIGPANRATIVRGALIALLAGLIGEGAPRGAPAVVTAVAAGATLLDGLDGWLARRTHMASRFGARFDMETDALLIMVLATLAWQFGKVGSWVLLSGLLRYIFVAVGTVVRRLRRPVPPSYRGKTIAVVQMIALILAIAPFVTPPWSARIAAIGLLALAASFLLDVVWLLRNSAPTPAVAPSQ